MLMPMPRNVSRGGDVIGDGGADGCSKRGLVSAMGPRGRLPPRVQALQASRPRQVRTAVTTV